MNPFKYLTLVTLVCIVAGKRTEIPPGKPVPDSLTEGELNELLASGSIERSDAAELAKRQEQLAASETQAEFQAERERLQDARAANASASASTVTGADDKGAGTGTASTGKGAGDATKPTGAAKK